MRVDGGNSIDECLKVAYAVAHSPLVKTAFFASDPNLGRILAAVGYAGITDLDQGKIELHLDDVHVVTQGGRNPSYREEDGARVMKPSEITIDIDLGAPQPLELVMLAMHTIAPGATGGGTAATEAGASTRAGARLGAGWGAGLRWTRASGAEMRPTARAAGQPGACTSNSWLL